MYQLVLVVGIKVQLMTVQCISLLQDKEAKVAFLQKAVDTLGELSYGKLVHFLPYSMCQLHDTGFRTGCLVEVGKTRKGMPATPSTCSYMGLAGVCSRAHKAEIKVLQRIINTTEGEGIPVHLLPSSII